MNHRTFTLTLTCLCFLAAGCGGDDEGKGGDDGGGAGGSGSVNTAGDNDRAGGGGAMAGDTGEGGSSGRAGESSQAGDKAGGGTANSGSADNRGGSAGRAGADGKGGGVDEGGASDRGGQVTGGNSAGHAEAGDATVAGSSGSAGSWAGSGNLAGTAAQTTAEGGHPGVGGSPQTSDCELDCSISVGEVDSLPEDACEAYVEMTKAAYGRCMSRMLSMAFGSLDGLEAFMIQMCRQGLGLPGQPADLASSAWRDCMLAMANAPCGCQAPEIPACEGLVNTPGSLEDGAACSDGSQCQSRVCSSSEDACGVCEPVVGENESCADLASFCAIGLYCDPNELVCKPELNRCDACSPEDDRCGEGLTCINGQCSHARLQVGDDCTRAPNGCGELLNCGEEGLCVDTLAVITFVEVGEGETCNSEESSGETKVISRCNLLQYCTADQDGICAPRHGEGDDCVTGNGDLFDDNCAPELDCIEGKCTAPVPLVCE